MRSAECGMRNEKNPVAIARGSDRAYSNPTHGRFTSVDPLTASATIRNPQTLNRYSYALNSSHRPLAKGEKPIAGDAALYYDGSSFLHTATYNADGTVRSKGGIEPLFLSAKPGPGKGTAWNRGGSIQVWTTRATVSEEKK